MCRTDLRVHLAVKNKSMVFVKKKKNTRITKARTQAVIFKTHNSTPMPLRPNIVVVLAVAEENWSVPSEPVGGTSGGASRRPGLSNTRPGVRSCIQQNLLWRVLVNHNEITLAYKLAELNNPPYFLLFT